MLSQSTRSFHLTVPAIDRRKSAVWMVALLVIGSLPLATLLVPSASAATTVYSETFDATGPPGWTLTGVVARQDCLTARSGCSLQISSQVQGQIVTGERPLSIPLENLPHTLSFAFRAQSVTSTTPSWMLVNLSNGTSLRLLIDAGAVAFSSNTTTPTSFFLYSSATWYIARVRVDPSVLIGYAEVRTAEGGLLARSANVTLPSNATVFERITFAGNFTGNPLKDTPRATNYDDLLIAAATPPAAPVISGTGGPSAGEITLTWTPPADDGGADITTYSIYASDPGASKVLVANLSASARSFTETGLMAGQAREYIVRAWNAAGQGAPSATLTVRAIDLPSAPRGLVAVPGASVGKVALNWTVPASSGGPGATITGYKVYRGLTQPDALVAQVSGATLAYVDANRQNGTTYHYAVTATNAAGEGPASTEATSKPRPDETTAPASITVTPSTAWTGDSRSASFSYTVTASECEPAQSCDVTNEWRILQDDGTILASGTNVHTGHAEATRYDVSTTIAPIGSDGVHELAFAVNARSGSTNWSLATRSIVVDAPTDGSVTVLSMPQLNDTTRTGDRPLHVNFTYSVQEKRCRTTESCPTTNDWRILLDGNSPYAPDGLLLAEGTNVHHSHGEAVPYSVSQSVHIPPLDDGLHYVKIAARADADAPWRVTHALLSSVIFAPDLDDPGYATLAGGNAYEILNEGESNVWQQGVIQTGPFGGHSGDVAWGTTILGAYPPNANGTLRIKDLPVPTGAGAQLSFWLWHDLEPLRDVLSVTARSDGAATLLQPTSPWSYTELPDGSMAWTGSSDGWQLATFDLLPYAGSTIDVDITLRTDEMTNLQGAFIDDVQVTTPTSVLLRDDMEGRWIVSGSWSLGDPATGPAGGFAGPASNAWAVAATADYLLSSTDHLVTPRIPLIGSATPTLSFHSWLQAEAYHDHAYVEVSEDDGGTWHRIQPMTATRYSTVDDGTLAWTGNTMGWTNPKFDLSPFKESTIRLRFTFQSDASLTGAGWFLSDIRIDDVPLPDAGSAFPLLVQPRDAFYAYFETTGSTAGVTTPGGQTISVRYTGTSGDVIAKLTADGTLTARRALPGLNGPVSIPASDFVVTGAPFEGASTDGTWTVRGAPTAIGTGATQLRIGGKVFDNVALASEPIEGAGTGRLAGSTLATLTWNWHNQQAPRHDADPTTASSPEETLADVRRTFDVDGDADGFSDKGEVESFASPLLATSTPRTDDDKDGIPNMLEESLAAAADPFLDGVNELVNPALHEDDRYLLAATASMAHMDDAVLTDYDSDGVPDQLDRINERGEALVYVDTDVTRNYLQLTTTKAGRQLLVLFPPDWRSATVIELGSTTPGANQPISYNEFFTRVAQYEQETPGGTSDAMLSRILRARVGPDMTLYWHRPAATQALSPLSLAHLDGTPADGTWIALRDSSIASVSLTVAGRLLQDDHLPVTLSTRLGAGHLSWSFLSMHSMDVDCLTPTTLLRDSACGRVPTGTEFRTYTRDADTNMTALLAQLRDEYQKASLLPELYEGAPEPTATEPTGTWSPTPEAIFTASGTRTLDVNGTILAVADHGASAPRLFDWEYRYFAAHQRLTGEATIILGLEPSDASTQGTTLLLDGATLLALGLDTTRDLSVTLDDDHASATAATTDANGDGRPDYLVDVPHFSKAWVSISGFPPVKDISMWDATRGFAALGKGKFAVYDLARSTNWTTFSLDSPYSGSGYELYAIHATSATEAWIAGGAANMCPLSTARAFVTKVTYNPSTGAVSKQNWENLPDAQGASCSRMSDISGIGNDIWAAGTLGLYRLEGTTWKHPLKDLDARHVQMRSTTDGFAFIQGASNDALYRYNGVSWQSVTLPPVSPDLVRPASMTMTRGGNSLWIVEGGGGQALAAWEPACNCWRTPPIVPSGYMSAVYGTNGDDAWIAGEGESSDGNFIGAAYHYGYGQHKAQTGVASAGVIWAVDFTAKNDGWMGSSAGVMLHYTGTNSPPNASFVADRASATTLDTVTVDASASSDPDNDPLQYVWNWGDGTTSSGVTSTHRYREGRSSPYTITLSVADAEGGASTTTRQVTVSNAPLSSGSSVTMTFDAAGQEDVYQFTVPTGKDILRLRLSGPADVNFDVYAKRGSRPTASSYDVAGTSATSTEDARLNSPPAGTYVVMVRAASGAGTYTLTPTYHVKPTTPSVTQTPNPASRSASFTLTGSSTTQTRVYYTAAWGDGTADSRSPSTGTSQPSASFSFSHSFAADGDHTVKVTAIDEDGLTTSTNFTVAIRDQASGATEPPTGISAHAATLNGNVGDLGGYANAQVWFNYGTSTSYGSSTPQQTRGLGAVSAQLSGLASGTRYHYQLAVQNARGTFLGKNQEFFTPNAAVGAPTLDQTARTTSRSESFCISGAATDPDGDDVTYTIQWGDGATETFPANGDSVPSGASYNACHAYTAFGVKTINVTATDVSGSPTPRTTSDTHTVADMPTGTTEPPTSVVRTSATFQGTVTSLGGDPAGVQAWFEYGPNGAFTMTTPKMVRTATGAVSVTVEGLTPGQSYTYRLVVDNVRGTTTTADPETFSANAMPTFFAVDTFDSSTLQGTKVDFMAVYKDALNEAPASGYPRVVIDGTTVLTMAKTDTRDAAYTDGATYFATWTATSGAHTYAYEVRDGVPITLTTAGKFPSLRVNESITFRDGIDHNPARSGEPPAGWYTDGRSAGSQCWSSPDSPYWHTVDTPAVGRLANAPDQKTPGGSSVSLWFGTESGPGAGTYDDAGTRACGRVVSPKISLARGDVPALRFWSYFVTEDGGETWDTKRVLVRTADGKETAILNLSKPAHGREGWAPVATSLAGWAGKDVWLVFEFDSRDSDNNAYPGWYVNELLVGHDSDLDGIPDVAEDMDKYQVNFVSNDRGFARNPSSTAKLEGIQSSYAMSATSEVIVTNTETTTIRLNTSQWSATVYDRGNRGPGTDVPQSLGFGFKRVRTNLSAAGLDLRTLNAADQVWMTISSTSGWTYMDSFTLRVQGRTASDADDSDGDGVADGGEAARLGTVPFLKDPDNDLLGDREDPRPFTPDSPPVVTRIRTNGGDWKAGIQFEVSARYGVKNVYVDVTGVDGSHHKLVPSQQAGSNGNVWNVTVSFPVEPQSFHIGANDSTGSTMEIDVPYSNGKPASLLLTFGTWSGSNLLNKRTTTIASLVGLAEQGVIWLLLIVTAMATYVVSHRVNNDPDTPPPPSENYITVPRTDLVGPAWNLAPGTLGCARTLELRYGWSGVARDAATVGAYGIVSDNPGVYANAQAVYNRVDTVMGDPTNRWLIQDSLTTGALVSFDANADVWQKWNVVIDPVTCTGHITNEQRQKWGADLKEAIKIGLVVFGAGTLLMTSSLIKGKWEDWRNMRTDRVRIMDAKDNHNVTFEKSLFFPSSIVSGGNRKFWHSVEPDADMGQHAQQLMFYGWQSVAKQGRKPTWYWNESRAWNGVTTEFVGNDIVEISDSPAHGKFMDQMAGGRTGVPVLWTRGDPGNLLGALLAEEARLCEVSATRDTYLPTAWFTQWEMRTKVHMTIEVAQTPAEFLRGGC